MVTSAACGGKTDTAAAPPSDAPPDASAVSFEAGGGCCNANPDPCCRFATCNNNPDPSAFVACQQMQQTACEAEGGTYDTSSTGGWCSFAIDATVGNQPETSPPCCNANPDPCCPIAYCGDSDASAYDACEMKEQALCEAEGGTYELYPGLGECVYGLEGGVDGGRMPEAGLDDGDTDAHEGD
jgi:hypothetical protein